MDSSQVDARGRFDIQLVKGVVEQGRAEARAVVQQGLDRTLRRVAPRSAEATPINDRNTAAMLKEHHTRMRSTVVGTAAPIAARLDALERMRTCTTLPTSQAAAFDHEALVPEPQAMPMPHWRGAGPFCCGTIPDVVSTPASPMTHAGIPSWPLHLILSLSTLAPNHLSHQGRGSFGPDLHVQATLTMSRTAFVHFLFTKVAFYFSHLIL